MIKPKSIGINTHKFTVPSKIKNISDDSNEKLLAHPWYMDNSTNSSDVLPNFDRSNLVAWWPFISDLKDYSGNGFHWQFNTTAVSPGSKPLFLPALRNKALYLFNMEYTLPNNSAFRFGTSAFTIMFWLHVNSWKCWSGQTAGGNATGALIHMRASDSDRGWEFFNNAAASTLGKMCFRVRSTDLLSSTIVPDNKWTHYAVVRKSTATNDTLLYINGILNATQTIATNITSTSYLSLGKSRYYGKFATGVSIQHLMIFNRIVIREEIIRFMSATGRPFTYFS